VVACLISHLRDITFDSHRRISLRRKEGKVIYFSKLNFFFRRSS